MRMRVTDYRAILSAVEQALTICDKQEGRLDESRRKICEDLRKLKADLVGYIGPAAPEVS